jgi:hypothetical protein
VVHRLVGLGQLGRGGPSIGTVADYDYALAESLIGLYKTECVSGPDTRGWDDLDELELATPVLGPVVQRRPAPRALRERRASGVRSSVLRCPADRPPSGSSTAKWTGPKGDPARIFLRRTG